MDTKELVATLGDASYEREQAMELLSEAIMLRQWEDRLSSLWSDWDVRAERFLRGTWEVVDADEDIVGDT